MLVNWVSEMQFPDNLRAYSKLMVKNHALDRLSNFCVRPKSYLEKRG